MKRRFETEFVDSTAKRKPEGVASIDVDEG